MPVQDRGQDDEHVGARVAPGECLWVPRTAGWIASTGRTPCESPGYGRPPREVSAPSDSLAGFREVTDPWWRAESLRQLADKLLNDLDQRPDRAVARRLVAVLLRGRDELSWAWVRRVGFGVQRVVPVAVEV